MKWCLVLTLEPRTTIHLDFTELSRSVPPDTRILHSSHTRFNDSIMSEYASAVPVPHLTHHLRSSLDLSLNPPSTLKDLFESKWQPSSHRVHHQTRVTPCGRNMAKHSNMMCVAKRLEICFHFHLCSACRANLNQVAIFPSTAADKKLSRPVPRAEDLGP